MTEEEAATVKLLRNLHVFASGYKQVMAYLTPTATAALLYWPLKTSALIVCVFALCGLYDLHHTNISVHAKA